MFEDLKLVTVDGEVLRFDVPPTLLAAVNGAMVPVRAVDVWRHTTLWCNHSRELYQQRVEVYPPRVVWCSAIEIWETGPWQNRELVVSWPVEVAKLDEFKVEEAEVEHRISEALALLQAPLELVEFVWTWTKPRALVSVPRGPAV